MARGVIHKLVSDRGFGFIREQGKDDDVFFHCSMVDDDCFDELEVGDRVTFEWVNGDRGRKAVRVKPPA